MLNIIKASAGSGKTYRLTEEYIRLLFETPNNYRHILAVTFTNKATEEMKSRIIAELNRLASGQPSGYLNALMNGKIKKTEAHVREEARKLLVTILHDYSAFSISTIDRFFQQTIRSFTREVGLQGSYNVELDITDVLEQTIDRFLFDLDDEHDKELLNWLIRFAESRIEEGGSWDIRRSIVQLASELLKEKYKTHSAALHEKLSDKSFLSDYHRQLITLRAQYEAGLRRLGEEGVGILRQTEMNPADSSYKWMEFFGNIARWKLPDSLTRINSMIDNPDKWIAKKASPSVKAASSAAFASGLNDCLKAIVDRLEDAVEYNTAGEIARQFHALGILVDIDRKMDEYAKEKNILLISDTTELLSTIIGDSDVPFVYEKVGTRVHHYMIDEFQDTSGLQWRNFSPLIHDSLASGRKNLIVGDVKQSIYRWRNSDWTLLGERLETEIPSQTLVEVLPTNWRSSRLIVQFNNTLFTRAAQLMEEAYRAKAGADTDCRITNAYRDLYQQPSPKPSICEGRVHLSFVEKNRESDWQADALDLMVKQIEQLQLRGYTLRDIGILVRTKAEGNRVAERLLRAKEEHSGGELFRYDFISDEALFIAHSRSVSVLIALLSHFQRPDERLLKLMLGDLLTPDRFSLLDRLRTKPLFELCEEMIRLFELNLREEEGIYIQAFQDVLLDFIRNNPPDPGAFLEWWQQSGVKKTVSAPSGQDAIQILTIHKSKGLEYRVVMIPLCEWSMDHNPNHLNILWCRPPQPPFNAMPLVPIKYGQALLHTHFAPDYLDELLQAHIDNLNLAYVAFTRAREELILTIPKYEKNDSPGSLAKLLWSTLQSARIETDPSTDRSYLILNEYWNQEQTGWELGEKHHTPATPTPPPSSLLELYRVEPPGDRLQLRLKSKGFFHDRKERVYGNRMHDILSRMSTLDDLSRSLDTAFYNGEIDQQERSLLYSKLKEAIAQTPEASLWFGGSYRVMNEVEILCPDGRIFRPDRVMRNQREIVVVDYKFGQTETPAHHRQVKRYLEQIGRMGYDLPLRGVLWYVELEKVVEV